jgi:pyruvate dehydrogenase E2 component (dihydrolipoamide acetyltransferase)
MATDIQLPDLGDDIESGEILEVFVSEGEVVEKGQGLVEVETGKATVVVPSEISGKVVKLLVSAGDSIAVGGVIVQIEQAAGSEDPEKPAASKPKAAKPKAAKPKAAKPEPASEPVAPVEPPQAAASQPVATTAAPAPAESATPIAASVNSGSVIPASPSVRRFAREVGVELAEVHGSGEGGRISRDDVLAVVRNASKVARSSQSQSKKPNDNGMSDDWGGIRVEKVSNVRRAIATNMHKSWSTVPRVTNFDDADVTELERIRQASKQDYANQGIKLTSLPFLLKSVAMSLRQNPDINATIDLEAGEITYKEYVNIGIAVDSERGLMVPCLRHVEKLSISDIARQVAEMATKVRGGKISMDDMKGGTFTVSNLGAIGGTYSTPIVNVPEVAILLIGRSRKMPVVTDNDEIAIRLMMPLSLSYDHRLVDGATATRFLNDVKAYLEAPSRLLLAP